ncbi:hypothetical protein A3Q56_05648 [Intoshia linei]|uniref:SURP motif domain-containing protein n=1 Tax=Intoshia linei TaxID=1819745 RepID=A0A177AYW7_9BILA|nr:hypothetical protein A3Q56_05648 [Intoshia linei]
MTHRSSKHVDYSSLLVFGYQCKVFNSQDIHTYVDLDKRLIPCISDASLMIDRFDCRGTLMDMKDFDGNINHSIELSAEELEIEKICDGERYKDLEYEKQSSDDESCSEIKKLHKYAQFSYNYEENKEADMVNGKEEKNLEYLGIYVFNYNYPNIIIRVLFIFFVRIIEPTCLEASPIKTEEKQYLKPKNLNLPDNIILPQTMNQHYLIEKTANYISKSGTQSEILLKTRQSKTSSFDFMDSSNDLYPYYKLLIQLIKENKYSITLNEKHSDSSDDSDGYLHPSLISKKPKQSILKSVEMFKHNVDLSKTVYGKLVSNLSEKIKEDDLRIEKQNNERKKIKLEKELAELADKCHTVKTMTDDSFELYSAYYTALGSSSLPIFNAVSPPPATCLLIEKIAKYVSRIGDTFEDLLKSKNEPRLSFIHVNDVNHCFYWLTKQKFINSEKLLNEQKQKLITSICYSDDSEEENSPKLPQHFTDINESIESSKRLMINFKKKRGNLSADTDTIKQNADLNELDNKNKLVDLISTNDKKPISFKIKRTESPTGVIAKSPKLTGDAKKRERLMKARLFALSLKSQGFGNETEKKTNEPCNDSHHFRTKDRKTRTKKLSSDSSSSSCKYKSRSKNRSHRSSTKSRSRHRQCSRY